MMVPASLSRGIADVCQSKLLRTNTLRYPNQESAPMMSDPKVAVGSNVKSI
jgi:hypothetical protein